MDLPARKEDGKSSAGGLTPETEKSGGNRRSKASAATEPAP
jgi:hypothetical protein